MKIDVTEDKSIRIKEAYNSVIFEGDNGQELIVCQRDGEFEIAIKSGASKGADCYRWYSASNRGIYPLAGKP